MVVFGIIIIIIIINIINIFEGRFEQHAMRSEGRATSVRLVVVGNRGVIIKVGNGCGLDEEGTTANLFLTMSLPIFT